MIVPRNRKWMGWTLNFARPSAVPVALCMAALVGVPVVMVRGNGGWIAIVVLIGTVSILAVCLLSAYLSSSRRWRH